MIEIDASGFDRYAGDLAEAARRVAEGVPGVVSKGALNVKKDWNAAFGRSEWFRLGGSVTYDVRSGAGWVEAAIGPDKDRHPRAALANIAHFGGANGGGGTIPDPQTFLDREAPGYVSALERLIQEALS